MINSKSSLLATLDDDPFNLLVVKQKVSTHRDIPKMVIEAFEDIVSFYDTNGREPNKNNDRSERTLCAKLAGIRADENQIAVLKEKDLDKYGLLDTSSFDDPFNLLGDDEDDIFTLKHVSKEINMPDYIAKRKPCKDFQKYEELFKGCHEDLQKGRRDIADFRSEKHIKEGLFFILKGVMGYVASVGKSESKNAKYKRNGRLKCIFENGTQSDMLLRSLSAEFYKDGQIISQLDSEIEDDLSQIKKDDKLNGYIYVLKSLSLDETIRGINDLYKIGYSTTPVKERIKNAKNEPTYLMADVEIIASYQCYNMNTQKFEQLLHQFFGSSCLDVKIIGNDKRKHTPREWFIAPLEVIQKVVNLLVNGEIIYYRYDDNLMEIVQIL
ncbi:MAG: GIY-YIG nuclease family protein [Campylobacterota bacterium]|nr:GIY-YIG nuclease family protein [Campylobacterota bacterium]